LKPNLNSDLVLKKKFFFKKNSVLKRNRMNGIENDKFEMLGILADVYNYREKKVAEGFISLRDAARVKELKRKGKRIVHVPFSATSGLCQTWVEDLCRDDLDLAADYADVMVQLKITPQTELMEPQLYCDLSYIIHAMEKAYPEDFQYLRRQCLKYGVWARNQLQLEEPFHAQNKKSEQVEEKPKQVEEKPVPVDAAPFSFAAAYEMKISRRESQEEKQKRKELYEKRREITKNLFKK
jgi:hypothetical protein